MDALTVNRISKAFQHTEALNQVSFEVDENEIFGLIGPDGAGKTTLFRLIATLLLPDEGTITMFNEDVVRQYKTIRKWIGYMAGRFSLYQDLTVEENMNFYATVFGTSIKENYDLVKDIYSHIEPFKNRLAGNLSGGMKQKLALSCALIHKPRLLILDEPTTGVDAVSRKEFWEMLAGLRRRGITILVSTPYMDEAMLCDRVALIQKGSLLAVDAPRNLVSKYAMDVLSIRTNDLYKTVQILRRSEMVQSAFLFGQTVHATIESGSHGMDELREYLKGAGLFEVEIEKIEAGIEDCFIDLMAEVQETHRDGIDG
jgi:ABC-type multidrug transport system ATPase subunit